MKTLQECSWKAFRVKDLFNVETGANISKNMLKIGMIPRITATDTNNGVDWFTENIDNKGFRIYTNRVSISFLGSCFYQPYQASYDMKIHNIGLKDREWNPYIALFVANQCKRFCEHINYGNQLSSTDLPKQQILLPVTPAGTPDWQFMEDYMREVEKKLLSQALPVLQERISNHKNTSGGVKIDKQIWKEFALTDIFVIKDGYYNKKPPFEPNGNIPFLGATQYDNGITGFYTLPTIYKYDKVGTTVMNDKERRVFRGNCIAITNNGSVGNAYYQVADFTCSHDITPIYLKNHTLNRYIALFLIPLIMKSGESFEYAKKWRPKRMRKSQLLLPVTSDGTPDYEFMEAYMQEIEHRQLREYLATKDMAVR